MPKLKTRKSITKRFRITKNGVVLRGQSFTSHLRETKSAKKKRALSGVTQTNKSYAKRIIKRMGVKIRKKKNI